MMRKSPEDAAKTYTKMYKNPVMSVELDDDDWVKKTNENFWSTQ